MIFAFVDAKQVAFPISVMCSVLGVSSSGFYAWKKRPQPAKAVADAQLAVEIAGAHKRSRGIYGSPRIHADLRAKGRRVSRKRVARLMREKRIEGRQKRRFVHTTDSRHTHPIAPNLVDRNFTTEAPNKAWVGDVTFIRTAEGWLYLAVLIDLFSRRVVGWATSDTNDRALALEAFHRGMTARRPEPGLMHHTDRGSPYACVDYRAALDAHDVRASMSRAGNCYDNAVAESFFATLKTEHTDLHCYASRAAATESVSDYIDNFYNLARRHSHLGYVSPIEFELRAQTVPVAA